MKIHRSMYKCILYNNIYINIYSELNYLNTYRCGSKPIDRPIYIILGCHQNWEFFKLLIKKRVEGTLIANLFTIIYMKLITQGQSFKYKWKFTKWNTLIYIFK